MGCCGAVFAQWATPWWDVSVYKWAQANDGFNGGELGSVRNIAHPLVHPRSRTLFLELMSFEQPKEPLAHAIGVAVTRVLVRHMRKVAPIDAKAIIVHA